MSRLTRIRQLVLGLPRHGAQSHMYHSHATANGQFCAFAYDYNNKLNLPYFFTDKKWWDATLRRKMYYLSRLKHTKTHITSPHRYSHAHNFWPTLYTRKKAFNTVDERPVGMSTALSQETDKTSPKVAAYVSRALTNVEALHSQAEKEALAIV